MPTLHTHYNRRPIPATDAQEAAFAYLLAFHDARLVRRAYGSLLVTLRACDSGCCAHTRGYRRVAVKPDGTVIDAGHGHARPARPAPLPPQSSGGSSA